VSFFSSSSISKQSKRIDKGRDKNIATAKSNYSRNNPNNPNKISPMYNEKIFTYLKFKITLVVIILKIKSSMSIIKLIPNLFLTSSRPKGQGFQL